MNREEAIELVKENKWKIENETLRIAFMLKRTYEKTIENHELMKKFGIKKKDLKEKKVEVRMRG